MFHSVLRQRADDVLAGIAAAPIFRPVLLAPDGQGDVCQRPALVTEVHRRLARPALAGEAPVKSMDDILAAAPASAWRAVDPENTLYLTLPQGRVVIELAPAFAPNHVANIKALVRERYFDGLVVERVQDNYVVQ